MFQHRSTQKELLDAAVIPKSDLFRNLYELNVINRYLGGHRATLSALEKLNLNTETTYTVIDIGCGGGDTLLAIAKWARKRNIKLRLIGVDLKPDCIEYASAACKDYPEISFLESDYQNLEHLGISFDIAIASLFCHHLSNAAIVDFWRWCAARARLGFIVNDLHRHPLAYYSIAALTFLFSQSYLVRNDAKLSVLRGFTKSELQQLSSVFTTRQIRWSWAFRWVIVLRA